MYEFTSKNRGSDRIVFLLTLDKKKKTERIIIGESEMVNLRIEKNIGDVVYDETRPLGQLLLNFESDPDKSWNVNSMGLHDNFAGLFPTKNIKRKALKSYTEFLRQKYESGEPSAVFAAVKTWEDYWRCFGIADGSDVFLGRAAKLYKPFFVFNERNRLWEINATKVLSSALFAEESKVELWYPAKENTSEYLECVVAHSSFLPTIFYYLKRIEEWGLVFQHCKVCGVNFLTTSKHFELCSDMCRKVTAAEAKRQYDERNKGDKLEMTYENHYQYWYNRGRKLKRNNAPDEEIAVFSKAFDKFKKGAVQRKAKVKSGKMKFAEFTSWLVEQQDIVDGLVKHGRG